MDEVEVKLSCKVCGESFNNIRALCGHKQIHGSVKKSGRNGGKKGLGFQGIDEQSCGFEENHRKIDGYATFCKKCDKGFRSFKALHGHMRLHSVKSSRRRLLGKDLRLPNNLPRDKRSVRRYKINTCSVKYSFWSNWNSRSFGRNCIDEEELKEVASCLLMLAKGGGFCSSANNNVSVDSEMRNFDTDTTHDDYAVINAVKVDDFGRNFAVVESEYDSVDEIEGLGFDSDVCKTREGFSGFESDVCKTREGFSGFESDVCKTRKGFSGFESDVCKTREGYSGFDSDVCETRGKFMSNDSDVCENRAEFVECEPGFGFQHESELYDTEIKDAIIGFPIESSIFGGVPDSQDCGQHESELCGTEVKDEINGVPLESSGFGGVSDSQTCSPALEGSKSEFIGVAAGQVSDKMDLSSSGLTVGKNSQLKYVCCDCDKGFLSPQALGGHRTHCPRSKRSCTSETAAAVKTDVHSEDLASPKTESESVELEVDDCTKTRRRFTCLVCCKRFPSGQALGGHMRAHFQGPLQSRVRRNAASDHTSPAPAEGEASLRHVTNPYTLPALVPVS